MRAIGDECGIPQVRHHTHTCPICEQVWDDYNPQCSMRGKAVCDDCDQSFDMEYDCE